MAPDPDDDALRWEGDDDPTLAPGWKAVGTPVPLAGAPDDATDDSTATLDDDARADASDSEAAGAAQTGSVELVVLGVLGGIYLLYTIGWLITALRTTAPGLGIVDDAMYTLGLWLAVLAPALWLGAVVLALGAVGDRGCCGSSAVRSCSCPWRSSWG